MCGIVGILGNIEVTDRIVNSLKKLEYRGYDSAGVAVLTGSEINIRKIAGKIANLEVLLKESPVQGVVGIGHTRWATHGAPEDRNAHPFTSGRVAIVHNGIIENYAELKKELMSKGVEFKSETDTEVLMRVIDDYYKQGMSEYDAVKAAFQRLHGAFAVAVMFAGNDNLMIGMRKGAPLAIGIGKEEMYLGSDALALAPFTNQILYLDDGEIAELSRSSYKITDMAGSEVKRTPKTVNLDATTVGKGDFEHYMLKEIYEQPEIVGHLFNQYYDRQSDEFSFVKRGVDFTKLKKLYIVACGTSYNSAHVAKYWFERVAKIKVEIDVASEFRYREPELDEGSASIFISQSGETADTLAALRHAKAQKSDVIALVNVEESTIANESRAVLPLYAGYEIGVASTKAFTCQLMVMAMLCIDTAFKKGLISKEQKDSHLLALHELPDFIENILTMNEDIRFVSDSLTHAKTMIYIGRGTSYPVAAEGALKIKEISYIHAEGIAAGEMKHGPIALIDNKLSMVVVAPYDDLYGKTSSNISEAYARSGKMILLTDQRGKDELSKVASHVITMPDTDVFTSPILYAIPMQLLAYHAAAILGHDVDQPRNLAKSVTVE